MNMYIIYYVVAALIVGLIKPITVYFDMPKLGYREYIISKKGREAEVISAFICIVMWVVLFLVEYKQNSITSIDPSLFFVLIGAMTGICISTIYTILIMPRGFYEKGMVTETKVVLYNEVKRANKNANKTKKLVAYTFPMLYGKKGKNVNLFVHKDDDVNVSKYISRHKK